MYTIHKLEISKVGAKERVEKYLKWSKFFFFSNLKKTMSQHIQIYGIVMQQENVYQQGH